MGYIRFMVEYKCWPLWRYDENGLIIDNCTPPEWENDVELYTALKELSDYYASLWIDENGEEDFHKALFSDYDQEQTYEDLLNKAKVLLEKKNKGKYRIVFDN